MYYNYLEVDMKKIFLFIIMILLVGCGKEVHEEKAEITPKEEIKEPEEEKYVDDNPITVGLYYKGKLVHDFKSNYKGRTDIATFNIVFTNEENLGSTNVKSNWKKYYDKYENIDDYKIGFLIEMEANGQKLENLLLDPSNQHKLNPYLYAYLYDGIHAQGRYTHLTMDDLKDNTIYSSIKLYLHDRTNEISSPIKLTVFTYKDENDFIDGHYRGNSFYTIEITKK